MSRTAGLALLLGAFSAFSSFGESAAIEDRERLPPPIESITSNDCGYTLELTAAPPDRTSLATAVLYSHAPDGSRIEVWRNPLPHRMRPRRALVANDGTTVLFDEWVRSPSRYAVIVINVHNTKLVEHSFETIAATLGVTTAALVRSATHGPWMSGIPQFADDNPKVVEVQAAGKTLTIDLATGQLGVRVP